MKMEKVSEKIEKNKNLIKREQLLWIRVLAWFLSMLDFVISTHS